MKIVELGFAFAMAGSLGCTFQPPGRPPEQETAREAKNVYIEVDNPRLAMKVGDSIRLDVVSDLPVQVLIEPSDAAKLEGNRLTTHRAGPIKVRAKVGSKEAVALIAAMDETGRLVDPTIKVFGPGYDAIDKPFTRLMTSETEWQSLVQEAQSLGSTISASPLDFSRETILFAKYLTDFSDRSPAVAYSRSDSTALVRVGIRGPVNFTTAFSAGLVFYRLPREASGSTVTVTGPLPNLVWRAVAIRVEESRFLLSDLL